MTHFVNPKEVGSDLVAHLVNMTKRGADQIGGAPTTPSTAPATSR
jgi:S-(hydroxymethyl)glutathione dehydrogenase / alcohol dehydrogenase